MQNRTYEVRDKAFREWEARNIELWNNSNLSKTTAAKEAWNAGWAARKIYDLRKLQGRHL